MTPEELRRLSDEEFYGLVDEFVHIENAPKQDIVSGLTQVWLLGMVQFLRDPSQPLTDAVVPLVLKDAQDVEYLEERIMKATEAGELPTDCTFSSWQVRVADLNTINLYMENARRDRKRQDKEENEAERVIEEAKRRMINPTEDDR